MDVSVFDTPNDLVDQLIQSIRLNSQSDQPVHIALSGGSTPKLLFRSLAQADLAKDINWSNLHFWWGDERCVPVDDKESNYGEALKLLFHQVSIPQDQLHRMRGEEEPLSEAARYRAELKKYLPYKLGRPQFDWILLGVGEDGHTASLFPGMTDYATEEGVVVARHPDTGQARLSLAAPVLRMAKRLTYMVTGASKASIVKTILQQESGSEDLPARNIISAEGQTEWFLDREAASKLDRLV